MCQYYDSRVAIYEHKMFYRIDHRHTGIYSLFNSYTLWSRGIQFETLFYFYLERKEVERNRRNDCDTFFEKQKSFKDNEEIFFNEMLFPRKRWTWTKTTRTTILTSYLCSSLKERYFLNYLSLKNNIFKIVGQRLTDSLDTVQPYGPNPTNKSFGVIFIPRWWRHPDWLIFWNEQSEFLLPA